MHYTMIAAIAAVAMTPVADACTGITLKAEDGSTVFARTCEWGTFDLLSRVVITPRGQEYTGHTPDNNKHGLTWKGQHGFVVRQVNLSIHCGCHYDVKFCSMF